MQTQLSPAIGEPWLSMEPLRVGSVPRSLRTPDTYVTVMDGDKPVRRIDVYGDHDQESYVFSTAIAWQKWVAIGFGDHFYLVGLCDSTTLTVDLLNYFAGLYVGPGYLLVTSASHLFRFEPDGALLWKSDELGIDGVVVADMTADAIMGEGEWDPPGGWRPFKVDSTNGKQIGAV